jgi:hypothetical protein
LVAPDGHEKVMVGGAFGKTRLLFSRPAFAASPRKNAELHFCGLADKVPFLGKQVLLVDAKDLGKELDLFAIHRTPQGFDVGENFSCHINVAEPMQGSNQDVLRPTPLIAQPRHHSPDHIGILGHWYLQLSFVTFQFMAEKQPPL